ncbi:cardiolipin synthase [Rhizobium sp. BR 314]|uniref:cardiolipin synthase n=1 Tax=Rhizobium sp. BR 314 TaxID=3040013 RepID=UPI0039BFF8F7
MKLSYELLVYAEWLIRLLAIVLIPRHRSPAAARAWILLVFFLPIPGIVLFLVIGSDRFPKWRKVRFQALRPFFASTVDALRPFRAALGERQPIAELASALGRFPATTGNRIELIDDYDAVIDRLVDDIDAATSRIHILVYIFADDIVGRRIADALGRARARGLDVKVMFDPVGSHRWRRGTLRMLQAQGVETQEALPLRFTKLRSRGDMRNHRKLFVIDGKIGYAGSQNLVAKDFRPGITNHELVVRSEGPIVTTMDAVIRGDWSMETGELPSQESTVPPQQAGSAQTQLLPSGEDYRLEGFESLLVWQVHQARERVVLVTPYFIPDEDVLGALRTAVVRGVTVDIVLSEVVDQRLVHLSQSSYYEDLLAAGVRIHLYRDYLLHAKNVGIDGTLAIVGSSNVDLRSFQLNEEVSMLLYDAQSIAQVDAIQRGYLENADSIDLETWRKRSPLRKVAENAARMVNSLL